MPKNVSDQNFEEEVIKLSHNKPVMVDFWAAWCGPCRAMAPILDETADELGESAVVAKLNVDENPEMVAKYEIQSIPSLKVFREGEIVDEMVGIQSKDAMIAKINEHK
ncbi:thioredoxin [Patescibacteria group bacterium]